ncbi:hypothetical protein EDM55_08065 [Brevibacillus centrosporus]|nr:hypothetical protein EDM55_08065 [Brevibacillus centrosporus]
MPRLFILWGISQALLIITEWIRRMKKDRLPIARCREVCLFCADILIQRKAQLKLRQRLDEALISYVNVTLLHEGLLRSRIS